ncbi:MAG: protein kinase [Oscillochloris sp.]|nr:protein kinase [Oscillochloris sp.]
MPLPSQLGNYTLEREIGRGSSSEVWLARHRHLRERHVAIKVLMSQDRDTVRRFEREAMIAARLRHPNIVQLYDYGYQEPYSFAAFEYVPGGSLRDLLEQRSRLPIGDALKIFRQIADSLDYAHSLKIVHRDVSSNNILVDPTAQRAVITDFGIARDPDRPITIVRQIMGTPGYLSPEHAQSATAVTHLSDLFCLGVVLYQMVCGQLPWPENTGMPEGPSFESLVFEPPSKHAVENVPPDFDRVMRTMLALDPGRRYVSAAAAVKDLDQIFARHLQTTQVVLNGEVAPAALTDELKVELAAESPVEAALGPDIMRSPLERSRRHAEELRSPVLVAELLNRWSEQGRMRRRFLGRLARLHKLVHRNVYFYRLRLLYEQRRFIEDEEEPDRAAQPFPIEVEVDRWQVELLPSREFADAPGDKVVLPGSTQVVPCGSCDGKGYQVCPTCNGKRRVLIARPVSARLDRSSQRQVAATIAESRNLPDRRDAGTTTAAPPSEVPRVEQVLVPCTACGGRGRLNCKRCAAEGRLVLRRRFQWHRRADLRLAHDDLPDLDENWLYKVCKAEVIYSERQAGGTRSEWSLIPQVAEMIKQAQAGLDADSRIVLSELTVSVIPVAEVVFDLGKSSDRDLYKLTIYGFENMIPTDWRFLDWERVVTLIALTAFFFLTIIVSFFALL